MNYFMIHVLLADLGLDVSYLWIRKIHIHDTGRDSPPKARLFLFYGLQTFLLLIQCRDSE